MQRIFKERIEKKEVLSCLLLRTSAEVMGFSFAHVAMACSKSLFEREIFSLLTVSPY